MSKRLKHFNNTLHGLNAKIFSYFMIFTLVLVSVLFIFQIGFLDVTYRAMRVRDISNFGREIESSLSNESFTTIVENTTLEKDVGVMVINISNGQQINGNLDLLRTLLGRVDVEELMRFREQGLQGEATICYVDEKGLTDISVSDLVASKKKFSQDSVKAVLYFNTIINSSGENILIILVGQIVPMSSTIQILKNQLISVAVIMIVLAVLLSILLSRHIARPIERVNQEAKKLSVGNYDADFQAKGYNEIEELNATLHQMATDLKKADQMSKDLIANVSHDLRTPLTMISGYGEVMRDIPGENTPENVQVIIDEANRLTSLVNNLLDISKLQSGNTTLNCSSINASEMVTKVINTYRSMLENKGYDIVLQGDLTDCYINADPTRLLQVFYNLMNNAITHIGADKQVILKYEVNNNRVRFDVIDHGEGIAKEDLPLIWQRYYKVDKEHIRAETGSGLGLSIVKTILDLHHADYGVESELNQGSDFWFELEVEKG